MFKCRLAYAGHRWQGRAPVDQTAGLDQRIEKLFGRGQSGAGSKLVGRGVVPLDLAMPILSFACAVT